MSVDARDVGPGRGPSFERIDRRLAVAFLFLAAALMVAVSAVTTALSANDARSQRERLARVIALSMRPGFETAKKAGEYRLAQLARQMRNDDLGVAYIRLVDASGVLVEEGWPGGAERDDRALLSRLAPADAPVVVQDLRVGGRALTEVACRVSGGYQAEWVGVLQIGIEGEELQPVLLRTGLILSGVAAALLLAAWPLFLLLGRRLGAPIKTLARDFDGVMRHAPLHITIEDEQGRIDQASAAFVRAFGVDLDAHPALGDYLPPAALEAGPDEHPEVEVQVGGEARALLVSRFPVAFSPTGEVLRQGVIGADVTAWRRDQAERDRLVAAVENTDDQLLVTVPSAGIVYANPAFLRQTGYTEAEVIGRRPSSLLLSADDDDEATQRNRAELLAAFVADGSWRGRIVARRKDGRAFDCDLIVSPILGERGEVRAQVWGGRDVSHEVQLQAQLRESQKMEAVGRLAGGVAHDFNNLLTVIGGVTSLMQEEPLDPAQQDNLQLIADASRRATELTRQLLAFGRRQMLNIKDVDLNRVVEVTLPLLRRMVRPDVRLEFEPAAALWGARGDEGQIEQVLLNLTINAADAMPEGGQVTIRTENARLDGAAGPDGAPVAPGSYVALVVTDAGVGIPPEVLPKIFEPFFTTKRVGQGTGLGLATVHGIVRQTGGHIFVDSSPGVGTTFRVLLPRVAQAERPAAAGGPPPPAPPVLFMSGYSEELVDVPAHAAGRRLIQKPPSAYALLSLVHGVLSAGVVHT